MVCKLVPYSIISIDQNRFFNINYKVISLMFSNNIVDFNEKLIDVVDITTAQFPSTKSQLRPSAGLNPVCWQHVRDLRWWESDSGLGWE